MITREEWLRHAVELIDEQLFNGSCLLADHVGWQIACGWTKRSSALGETVFPYDGEDVTPDDFFPVTIHVNCTVKDPVEMIEILAHECIHAFHSIKGHGKSFGVLAKQIGFEKPYTKNYPSQYLKDNCESIYAQMKEKYGDFPGKPIVIHKEEKKKNKNTYILFCPECGYEVKVSKKVFEKHGQGLPTCVCGAKMARDCEDDEQNTED